MEARRQLPRDRGLSLRIAFVLLVLGAIYCGLIALPFILLPGKEAGLFVAIAVAVSHPFLAYRIFGAADALLHNLDAMRVTRDGLPQAVAAAERLAHLAGIQAPQLAAVESDVPNSFVVGTRRKHMTIVVTTSLLALLEPAELEAVLAHEASHIANHDRVPMALASSIAFTGASVMGIQFQGRDFRPSPTDAKERMEWIVYLPLRWAVGLPLLIVGGTLMLVLSRCRELVADRDAAILTGAPEHLMSALQKASDATARIPQGDLRRLQGISALCVVPTHTSRFRLLVDHPPLERRLAALGAIGRELGRAQP